MDKFDLGKWQAFRLQYPHLEHAFIDQIVVDSRRISSKNALFVALKGEKSDGHNYLKEARQRGCKFALLEKNTLYCREELFPLQLIEVENPLSSLQEIASIYRQGMNAKVIAVTGSFGKTMLKDLLHHILEAKYNVFCSPESFNSQLGAALSLLEINHSHDLALIEAGISKEGEMKKHGLMILPDHVIITNIKDAHLSTLGTLETIAQEKCILATYTPTSHWGLFPSCLQGKIQQEKTPYFWDQEHSLLPDIKPLDTSHTSSYQVIFPSSRAYTLTLREPPSYLVDLLKIGIKASFLLGVDEETIIEKVRSYIPETMRIELWKSQDGALIINDTYLEDAVSCDLALKQFESLESKDTSLKGKKIFLFGGLRRKKEISVQDIERIATALGLYKVDLCIIDEESASSKVAKHLATTLFQIAPQTEVIIAKNYKEAVSCAKSKMTRHDALILKGPKKRAINDVIVDFDESLPHNLIVINLAAIKSNIERIRQKIGKNTRIMVMVKALAYGTDDVRVAKFLKNAGVDILGVSYVDEASELRSHGVLQDIFVLNTTEYELEKAVKWNLEIALSDLSFVEKLGNEAKKQNKQIKVHLHVDTGMSRFGCKPQEALSLAQAIKENPHLILEGIMTHFACADDTLQDSFTLHQHTLFSQTIEELKAHGIHPKWQHACNSSATLRFDFTNYNMIRIGLAAYGLHTSCSSKDSIDLVPAISLLSRIVGINHLKKGDSISYSRKYVVEKEKATIAVLPIGYFDGLHRNYSNKAQVMIHGKETKQVGNICMDYMMCDISHIPEAKVGDAVLIFGEDENGQYLSPETLAHSGGSIVHELLTCLGPRIRRLFIYDESLRPR